jgi:hypothetical protein
MPFAVRILLFAGDFPLFNDFVLRRNRSSRKMVLRWRTFRYAETNTQLVAWIGVSNAYLGLHPNGIQSLTVVRPLRN